MALTCPTECALNDVLIFPLNGNICNNSNWMSITAQSISLSVPASILPQASPTSVSVKLLTPCQQWRRAYLDPVDGWVLVDLSHTNIFSASAERGVARVCVKPSTHTHTHIHTSFPESSLRTQAVWCPSLSPTDTQHLQFRPRWEEHWPHCHKQGKRFFSPPNAKLDPCPLHYYILLVRVWHPVPLTNH